jgi:FlaA1/EpsC-like NDP-sugar epimerase
MGEPIKIVDLARNLIELSGLKVGEDVEIAFTGMRPGEKVEEELLTAQEDLVATPFDKVRMQKNANFAPDRIASFVHELKSNVDLGNLKALYNDIAELVPEMQGPSFEELKGNMFA